MFPGGIVGLESLGLDLREMPFGTIIPWWSSTGIAAGMADGGPSSDLIFPKVVARVPRIVPAEKLVIAVAMGMGKALSLHAAMRGRLINGLITDEATAEALLSPTA